MREMDSSGTKGVRYSRLRDHFGIWTVLYGPRQGKSPEKGIILDGFENMVLICEEHMVYKKVNTHARACMHRLIHTRTHILK